MDNTAPLQFNDDEDVERPEQQIVDNGEIAGPDVAGMILEESGPGLTRFSAPLRHVSLDRSFTDFDTQLEQFAANAFCTPEAILACHSSDDVNGFLSGCAASVSFSVTCIASTGGIGLGASAGGYQAERCARRAASTE